MIWSTWATAACGLAVNQWPDRVKNDSSPGRLAIGKWTFFAVTYDATSNQENVG